MVSKIRSLDLSLNIILNALSIVIYETFNESQRHCHHLRQSLVFFFLKKKNSYIKRNLRMTYIFHHLFKFDKTHSFKMIKI